ncbi:MAG: hypothetical protein ACRD5H_01910 [Nitrososphaerales archaeon]
MKIYLAGTFIDQKVLRVEAARLWELGHEVTGSWLNEVARSLYMDLKTQWKKLAIKDLTEIAKADLVILDNRQSSGGKNVEWGVGCQQYQTKLLWLIGKPSNVFHALADKEFTNWDECINYLKEKNTNAVHSL